MKALIALALLVGCKQVAADEHVYAKTEWFSEKTTVSVVTYPSFPALRAGANRLGVKAGEGKRLMAFALATSTRCEMHVVEPSIDYQPQWIGHEFVHCIRGRFHK